MSFREKNAWIGVVTALVVWGFYFWQVGTAALAGTLDGDTVFWLFVWCMAISLAVMLPVNLIAARLARQKMDAPPDEREREIDARANKFGLALLEWSIVAILLASGPISAFSREIYGTDPAGATAIILVNLALFALGFSAMVREAIQIVHFRMMD